MRQELGFGKYYVGDYPTKGCYFKGSTAYFGVGGTFEQKSTSLSGAKWRIWCGSGSTMPLTPTVVTNPPVPSPISETKYCIGIEVVTDKYGQETGFSLTSNPVDGTNPKKMISEGVGSLESEKKYTKQVCVPKGKYTFTIEDTFGGLCCSFGKGSYSVSIDGEELVWGGSFTKQTVSHDIIAGYDPEISDRDEEWLEAHNTRRQAFHEKQGREYRPLHWSAELAKDASNWVDNVLPVCKHIRESQEEGENMAVTTHQGLSNTENPDHILTLWSDNLLKPGNVKDYPDNQTMTQVMWRGTRHVGCSDKFVKKADGSGYCYVSICRYSRAGNCSVNSYDNWLIPTLQDRTRCGNACPKEGCH